MWNLFDIPIKFTSIKNIMYGKLLISKEIFRSKYHHKRNIVLRIIFHFDDFSKFIGFNKHILKLRNNGLILTHKIIEKSYNIIN